MATNKDLKRYYGVQGEHGIQEVENFHMLLSETLTHFWDQRPKNIHGEVTDNPSLKQFAKWLSEKGDE